MKKKEGEGKLLCFLSNLSNRRIYFAQNIRVLPSIIFPLIQSPPLPSPFGIQLRETPSLHFSPLSLSTFRSIQTRSKGYIYISKIRIY